MSPLALLATLTFWYYVIVVPFGHMVGLTILRSFGLASWFLSLACALYLVVSLVAVYRVSNFKRDELGFVSDVFDLCAEEYARLGSPEMDDLLAVQLLNRINSRINSISVNDSLAPSLEDRLMISAMECRSRFDSSWSKHFCDLFVPTAFIRYVVPHSHVSLCVKVYGRIPYGHVFDETSTVYRCIGTASSVAATVQSIFSNCVSNGKGILLLQDNFTQVFDVARCLTDFFYTREEGPAVYRRVETHCFLDADVLDDGDMVQEEVNLEQDYCDDLINRFSLPQGTDFSVTDPRSRRVRDPTLGRFKKKSNPAPVPERDV